MSSSISFRALFVLQGRIQSSSSSAIFVLQGRQQSALNTLSISDIYIYIYIYLFILVIFVFQGRQQSALYILSIIYTYVYMYIFIYTCIHLFIHSRFLFCLLADEKPVTNCLTTLTKKIAAKPHTHAHSHTHTHTHTHSHTHSIIALTWQHIGGKSKTRSHSTECVLCRFFLQNVFSKERVLYRMCSI